MLFSMIDKSFLHSKEISDDDFPVKKVVTVLGPIDKEDPTFPKSRIGQKGTVVSVKEETLKKVKVIEVVFSDGGKEIFFPSELNASMFRFD